MEFIEFNSLMRPINLSHCHDFRDESDGIFVLGVVLSSKIFQNLFLPKVVLILNLKRYFPCDYFLDSFRGLKIAILANLGPSTRDRFYAIKA